MIFMGVITTIGSVKPFSHPTNPLVLMLLYQMIAVVIMAQVSGTLRSAVVERRKPVRPMKEPQMDDRKIVII